MLNQAQRSLLSGAKRTSRRLVEDLLPCPLQTQAAIDEFGPDFGLNAFTSLGELARMPPQPLGIGNHGQRELLRITE